jgi:hypothetical protein
MLELPRQTSLRRGLSSCMSNAEKLKVLMRNQEIRDRITLHLRQNVSLGLFKGCLDTLPILKVGFIKPNRQRESEVTESEVSEVFRRFGHL